MFQDGTLHGTQAIEVQPLPVNCELTLAEIAHKREVNLLEKRPQHVSMACVGFEKKMRLVLKRKNYSQHQPIATTVVSKMKEDDFFRISRLVLVSSKKLRFFERTDSNC